MDVEIKFYHCAIPKQNQGIFDEPHNPKFYKN